MQNKKIVKILKSTANVLLAAALVLPVLMLAGCARKLESEGMRIIDKKTGSSYSFMPAYLEPAARSKKVYAKATLSGAEQSLYTISGLEPSEWLCTEWGDILYSGTDIIASLYTFDPVRAYICDTEGTVSIALVAITGDDVALMRDRWTGGANEGDVVGKPVNTYVVKFESEKYPGIYYCLSLHEYADKVYFYGKYEGMRRVDATDIMEKYLSGEEESDTTAD